MTTMASPKPQASLFTPSSPEELSVVQVLDSSEPLVSNSSSECASECVQVLDSNEPLVPTPVVPCDVVLDSNGPLPQLPEPVAGSSFAEPIAGSSRDMPVQPSSSSSGSSGRRKNLYSKEVRSQWNLFKIFSTLGTHEQCIAFAEQQGLLPTEKMCTYHKKPMTLENTTVHGQVGQFRCRKGKCRNKSYSRSLGTGFEHARLPLPLIFQIMYMFSEEFPYEAVRRETSHWRESALSQATIADWFNYCREAVFVYMSENEEEREKIGGPGKIVQIDESKFGRRKYNRGRNIEVHWVLGLIEDGSDDLRLEVCPDNERSSVILIELIKKHVQEGTTIHTDFWKGYDRLSEYGFIHKIKNHSDVHTQRIESHWRVMKRLFEKDNFKGNFPDWLTEVTWRRRNKINHLDPFEELLKCIKYV